MLRALLRLYVGALLGSLDGLRLDGVRTLKRINGIQRGIQRISHYQITDLRRVAFAAAMYLNDLGARCAGQNSARDHFPLWSRWAIETEFDVKNRDTLTSTAEECRSIRSYNFSGPELSNGEREPVEWFRCQTHRAPRCCHPSR